MNPIKHMLENREKKRGGICVSRARATTHVNDGRYPPKLNNNRQKPYSIVRKTVLWW